MARDAAYKEFEELVSLIEATAAARNASVKSPDYIRDLITGRMREVDASIRFRLGTANILVTVECRKRNRKADDTWIEQLATKRGKIGASKTIAVSSAGFTKSAVRSAELHGVELRTLSEIKPTDVEAWFLADGVVHIFQQIENVTCSVKAAGGDDWLKIDDSMEPCFTHELVTGPFPAATLANFTKMVNPEPFLAIPIDGRKKRLEFDLDACSPDLIPVPPGFVRPAETALRLITSDGLKLVRRVAISLDVSCEVVSFNTAEGMHHLYQAGSQTVAQHSRFKGQVFGVPATFDHQILTGENQVAAVQFPSGVRLDSQAFTVGQKILDLISSVGRSAPAISICALCNQEAQIKPRSIVPAYLFPTTAAIPHERVLCSHCSNLVNRWDEYGERLLAILPSDLSLSSGGYLAVDGVDYCTLRLWLLSLLWRMSIGRHSVWTNVNLGSDEPALRQLLLSEDPGRPSQYPSGCVVPSFDGKRLDFLLQPDFIDDAHNRVFRAILGGIVFLFWVATIPENKLAPIHMQPGHPWIVQVIDWKEIHFLKRWLDGNFEVREH